MWMSTVLQLWFNDVFLNKLWELTTDVTNFIWKKYTSGGWNKYGLLWEDESGKPSFVWSYVKNEKYKNNRENASNW